MATLGRGMSSRAVQAEQTRQQILETAQRLFAEIGYEAASIQMIADEMSLTKAAVFYHFRAKADILRALMEPAKDHLNQLMDEAEGMRGRKARIEHVAAGYADFLVSKRHYAAVIADHHEPDGTKTPNEFYRRGLVLVFGEHPTGAERLAYNGVFSIPSGLPELEDLSDEELHEAILTTMLHLIRVPSRRR